MVVYSMPSHALPRPFRVAAAWVFDLIGPALHGKRTDETAPVNITWIVLLCLAAAIGILLIAAGHGAGRRGDPNASMFFWNGVVLILLSTASRVAWPVVARGERAFLLVLLAECLFLYKVLYGPTSFVQFDELLHWMSSDDILYRHKLFLNNSLLPINPLYPALEILTTSLVNLTGLTLFPAAMLVLAVLRATFIIALFLFFEKITESERIAAIACLVYMSCSTFVVFEAMFSYESLGIVLCVLIMLAEVQINRSAAYSVRALILPVMLLAALAVTHHLSAFIIACYLATLVVVEALRRKPNARIAIGVLLSVVVLLAVVFPLLWMNTTGNPLVGYLGPVIHRGIYSVLEKLSGSSQAREMFVTEDGTVQPIGNRIIGITSTVLLAIGLATGFFRSLALRITATAEGWSRLLWVARREWGDSRVVLLTLAAFGFPVSIALRLSSSGWEIGNRMNTFVFIAVGLVVAIAIVHFWQARITRWNVSLTSLALGTILLGGVIIGSPPKPIHGSYLVGADPGSVEPMGIEAAQWTRTWLGAGNRFSADRVNRTLLATYGDQNVISSIQNGIDASRVFLADKISPDTLYVIRKGKIDYLLVDLRLTTARALLGEYYERGEQTKGHPPLPSNLLKFDGDPNAARIFDNGWIVIYDVSRLHE
jgi:hypothetical protein